MVAGITVFNDKNSIQVDDRVTTYGLTTKYVTRDLKTVPAGINVFSPVVAGNQFHFVPSSDQRADIEVFNFTSAGSGVTENLGLQVFRADGSTAFHSSTKPLRVIDFYRRNTQKADGSPDTSKVTRSYTGYKRLGVAVPSRIPLLRYVGQPNRGSIIFWPEITINAGGSIDFDFGFTYIPPEVYDTPAGYNDFIIVDLSDY